MKAYIARRLLLIIPMMIGVTLISFFIIHLTPGDPTELLTDLNPNASPGSAKRMQELYHLDKPIIVQYSYWLKSVATLDFGHSFSLDARPVIDKITERIPITLIINMLQLGIILTLSIPIGVYAAMHPYSRFDKGATLFVFFGFSIPGFWLALLLMILFGVWLEWLPISGLTSFNHDQLSLWGKFVDYTEAPSYAGSRWWSYWPGWFFPLHTSEHAGSHPSRLCNHSPRKRFVGRCGRI